MRAGGVVEVQHLPNTHGHRVQLERGEGEQKGGEALPREEGVRWTESGRGRPAASTHTLHLHHSC